MFASSAVFSTDRRFRYRLDRKFMHKTDLNMRVLVDVGRPFVVIGLNGSVANETNNDPTISKVKGFAERNGFGWIIMVNVYGFVSTDPKAMIVAAKNGSDIVGPDNDRHLIDAATIAREEGGVVVGAWGANVGKIKGGAERISRVVELVNAVGLSTLSPIMCLGTNTDGSPEHPGRIPYARVLLPWSPR